MTHKTYLGNEYLGNDTDEKTQDETEVSEKTKCRTTTERSIPAWVGKRQWSQKGEMEGFDFSQSNSNNKHGTIRFHDTLYHTVSSRRKYATREIVYNYIR